MDFRTLIRSAWYGILTISLNLMLVSLANAAVPIGVYSFEGDLNDSSGSGNHGVISGTVGFDGSGYNGQAVSFAGGGYIKLPESLLVNNQDFTIALWFKTTSSGGIFGYQNVEVENTATNWIPLISVTDTGLLRSELWIGSSLTVISSTTVNDGNWHRVVVTADTTGNMLTVYLDGAEIGSVSGAVVHLDMSFNQIGVNDARGRAGLFNGWDYFDGEIDEFILYSEALTAAEIAKQTQSISFSEISDQQFTDGTVDLTAISSSGLSVSYSSITTSVCSISDSTVSFASTGTCSITAGQAGDATYSEAPQVIRSFEIQNDSTPSVTAPDELTINATALFTRVDFEQDSSASAIDFDNASLEVTTVDDQEFFRPGINTVTWQATNDLGFTATANQTVNVIPLVSFSKDQTVAEGSASGDSTVTLKLVLNGLSPVYPLEVEYTVSGTATNPDDHNLSSSTATFSSGETETTISFSIFEDSVADDGETVILTLSDTNINQGSQNTHTVTISESNIAPSVRLDSVQNSLSRLTVSRESSEGMVTVTATASDPNVGDNLTLDWSSSDNNIVDTDGNLTDGTLVFDPSTLTAGVYEVVVVATDDGSPSLTNQARAFIQILDSLPSLDSSLDSDGDGIDDASEGYADADRDGIPDYLDSVSECNVLPEQGLQFDGFLVEGDPGVCIRIGNYAIVGESGGLQVTDNDIEADTTDELVADPEASNIGGRFDFMVTDLPNDGQSVGIVIPQTTAIPNGAVYRKFISATGWYTFIEDANNQLWSATGEPGFCPPPGSDEYTAGLSEGDWCVQLVIEDGGPNDADGIVNRSIADPGGVSLPDNNDYETSGGGAIGVWWLLVLTGLGSTLRARAKNFGRLLMGIIFMSVTAQASENAQANTDEEIVNYVSYSSPWYIWSDLGYASGDSSKGSISDEFDDIGITTTVTEVDNERFSLGFGAGYKFSDTISLEFGYLDLGEVSIKMNGLPVDPDLLSQVHPQSAAGFIVGGQYELKLSDINLLFRAGTFLWEGDFSTSQDSKVGSDSIDGSDPFFGFGAAMSFDQRWQGRLLLQKFSFDSEDVNVLSAGLIYRLED